MFLGFNLLLAATILAAPGQARETGPERPGEAGTSSLVQGKCDFNECSCNCLKVWDDCGSYSSWCNFKFNFCMWWTRCEVKVTLVF